jgi:predicted RNase H-like HicB family nuclease
LIPEDDGSFSAVVLNLPGVGSCGATREEALRNVREAVLGAIESYAAHHEEIPWRDSVLEDVPKGAERQWILVNV